MNLRKIGLQQGLLVTAHKGQELFITVIKRFLKLLNVSYYDSCCPEEGAPLPVQFQDEQLQYYDPVTKTYIEVPTGVDLGYKEYAGLISQEDTNPPEIVEISNTLGTVITPIYNSVGNYTLQSSVPMPENKTVIFITSNYNDANAFILMKSGQYPAINNTIKIFTKYNGSNSNWMLTNVPFLIRVYN